jgi:uncharacterized protein with NRDE domain
MCTLVVAAGVVPGHPLVVVANRDEALARPAVPPFLWPDGFFAPRDEEAGGTWLGLNRHGVFVGITNRYLGLRDPRRLSRGALVTDALRLPSARAIHERMETLSPTRHNGFHLVYADANDVLGTISDGAHLAQLTFGRGLTFATERSFGAGAPAENDRGRIDRITSAWSALLGREGFVLEDLGRLLTEHDDAAPLSATCIHVPAMGYGTRSAMVLAMGPSPRMIWAEGPPCTTPFVEVDLRGLSAA